MPTSTPTDPNPPTPTESAPTARRLPKLGFVVGLAAEARIAARFGYPVIAGGGTPQGATKAAIGLVKQGATALVSFGFAGGLDPALPAGALIIPATIQSNTTIFTADPQLAAHFGGLTNHRLLAGATPAATATAKHHLHATTNAHAIDLESGSVAAIAHANGLPFVAVRAISDPADQDLPPAALAALNTNGGINLLPILRSLARHPTQLPALLKLAFHAARARRTLLNLSHPAMPAK